MITIAHPTSQQIRDKLDQNHWSAVLLSEILCSAYWGSVGIDLRKLNQLDDENFAFAVFIMGYRRQSTWDDEEFCNLAVWCRDRHNLNQWSKAE